MRRALITDAQERWSVATCRSLHRAGYTVTAAADSSPAVAHWSRSCRRGIRVPIPSLDSAGFTEALADELERERYACLILAGDASLLAVSRHRDRVERRLELGLGLPPHEAVAASMDKAMLVTAAAEAGLPCPATVVSTGVAEAESAADELGYPIVVKPVCSVYEADGTVRREGSRLATERGALEPLVARFGGRCLLQRAVEGEVHSCSGVFAGGRMFAFCLARYLRTWPPEAGNAAVSETVAVPSGLADAVGALLERIGWYGVFELELLRTGDGRFHAIDLNPRVYGSLALAIAAGTDLPATFVEWLAGGSPKPQVARAGVCYRWEDAELRRFASALRHGRLGEAMAVARPRRRVVHPHFSVRDPGPLVARLGYLGAKLPQRRGQPSSVPAAEPIGTASRSHAP